jgi:hypothetical protein
MSQPFGKRYRHSDRKVELEFLQLYQIITNLRQNATGVNVDAYAQALKNSWKDHELAVLERFMSSQSRAAGIRIETTEALDSDVFSALYVDATEGTPTGAATPVYFDVTGGSGLNAVEINHIASASDSAFKITNAGGNGHSIHIDHTNGTGSIVKIDSLGTHSGNYIGTDNGAVCDNAGLWTDASALALKNLICLESPDTVLGKIRDLKLYRYRYKADTKKRVFMGAMAEDWNRIFDNRSPGGIGGRDAAMVSLAGVQSLLKKVEALESRVAELENSNA